MTEVKSFDELQVGDIFLTEWIDGKPIKLTVAEKTECGLVIPVELGGVDVSLDKYVVVCRIE
ncbi:MAG: hypothetical protein LAT81_09895 [Oceanicaulis sp.]|nr:hypothetical protein [Oceanicaulis sp.]